MTESTRLAGKELIKGKVISFQKDINYYFQKGNHYFLKNNFRKALLYYKKTVELEPQNALNHYNLACLLSKMGQLEEANKVFDFIVKKMDPSITECYFLMAINFGLMEDLDKAQQYLNLYLKESPQGDMAAEAQELLGALKEGEEGEESGEARPHSEPSFKRKKEEILLQIHKWKKDEFMEAYEKSTFFRQIIKKILYHSQDGEKEDIIRLLGLLDNQEARRTLAEFVRNPWIKDRLKLMALLKLKNTGHPVSCQAYLKGEFKIVNLEQYPLSAPYWKEDWEKVLICALNHMRKNSFLDDEISLETMQALWLGFLNNVYPQVPRVCKPEVWAAGLEYCLAKHYYLKVTQEEISRKYGVSCSSVYHKHRLIKQNVKISEELFKVPLEEE